MGWEKTTTDVVVRVVGSDKWSVVACSGVGVWVPTSECDSEAANLVHAVGHAAVSTIGAQMEAASRDRQQTLAIRWILGAAFKRRISYRISLEKCSFAEILDAYRKRGIARKRRENLHGFAFTNRSFMHFR
uniref:Uncharacterized protein LOC114914108 n=1 Tax=Elaeis guineensis var. tenera TaxID=51953 RepID=A0A8N4EYT3_ELAGV|nr:uncharacterized protein LOC114914108 [Elaeis guineensis]